MKLVQSNIDLGQRTSNRSRLTVMRACMTAMCLARSRSTGMICRHKVRYLFIGLALLLNVSAHAQSAPENASTLRLAHALRLARSQPAGREAAALVAEQSHLRDAASHRYAPTVSLSVDDTIARQGLSDADVRGTMADITLSGHAAIDARVLDFGQRSAELAAAQSGLAAQIQTSSSVQLQLQLAVATQYAAVLADAELLSLSEGEASARAEVLEGIRALVDKGLRPRLDHTRARAELLRAQVDVGIYRQRSADDLRVLALQLGAAGTTFSLEPLPPVAACASESAIANAARRVAAGHPDLKVARANVSMADANERAADAAKLPALDFTAAASYGRSDLLGGSAPAVFGRYGDTRHNHALSAGLSIQWNALDLTVWDRAKAAAAHARAEREGLRAAEASLEVETVRTTKQASEAGLLLQRASELDALAQQSLSAELERYRMGEGSLLQLLDAQRLRHEAKVTRVEAQLTRDVACLKLQLQSEAAAH